MKANLARLRARRRMEAARRAPSFLVEFDGPVSREAWDRLYRSIAGRPHMRLM